MNTRTHKKLVFVLWPSNGKKDDERRLAEMALGVLTAIVSGSLSIDQAQEDLFNLSVYMEARRRRFDRRLMEFLEWGMELDDVRDLAPEGLPESYAKMTHLLERVLAHPHGVKKRRTATPVDIGELSVADHPGAEKLAMTGT